MAEQTASPGGGRNVKAIAFVVFIVIAISAVILLQGKDEIFRASRQPRVAEGVFAPTFTFPALDGRMVDLKSYRGKVVFLNIWATWCPPCREEMPSMERLYRELKGQDFEILAVSVDAAGTAAVAPFMKEHRLTFPALLDPRGTTQDLYGTTGVPESFIINKDGIIEKIVIGPMDWASPKVVRYFRDLIQGR